MAAKCGKCGATVATTQDIVYCDKGCADDGSAGAARATFDGTLVETMLQQFPVQQQKFSVVPPDAGA